MNAIIGPLVILIYALASVAQAQSTGARPASEQFQWKWKNDGIGFQIATCQTLDIEVKSWNPALNDTQGIPPYYMMAFPVKGTPVTRHIGNSDTSLSWEVTHAPGSKLLLTVVDSSGSFGGVPPRLFEVIPGVSTSCVRPEPSAPTFTISSNITNGNLATCEPWGITIKGGVPPYNLSIAAVNSPVITNVTIPSGFDAFTYINRAAPNGQMVVGVADFTGQWATGVPIVNTTGSENYDCVGLVSANGIASELAEEARVRRASTASRRTAIIAGVTVPLTVLLIGIGLGFWWYRRRQEETKGAEPTDLEPFTYQEKKLPLIPGDPGQDSLTGYLGQSKADLASQASTLALTSTRGARPRSYVAVPSSRSNSPSIPSPSGTTSTSGLSSQEGTRERRTAASFCTFPPSRKAAEAAQKPVVAGSSNRGSEDIPFPPGIEPVIPAGGEEIVIQHRDGGLVRELPPPYADRS